jgi:Zn-dependent peptidase ImmA (M78 family)
MSILKITTGNLRRTQAFDAELRSMSEIDKIANDFAEAILYQRDGRKRKPQIGKLVEKLAKLSGRFNTPASGEDRQAKRN